MNKKNFVTSVVKFETETGGKGIVIVRY